jgi:hypothetical protein
MAANDGFSSKPRPDSAERRRKKRDALGINVSLYSVTQSRVVLMVDASESGTRISGLHLPTVGKDVVLQIGDVELFGQVVRVAGEEAAVEFECPISESVLEQLQKVIAEQTQVALLHSR